MMDNPSDPVLFEKFVEKNKIHDEYRKQSFEETFSEYWILCNNIN